MGGANELLLNCMRRSILQFCDVVTGCESGPFQNGISSHVTCDFVFVYNDMDNGNGGHWNHHI